MGHKEKEMNCLEYMKGIAQPIIRWAVEAKASVKVFCGTYTSSSDRSGQRWAYLENYTHPYKDGLCDDGEVVVISMCRNIPSVAEKIELGTLTLKWGDLLEVNQAMTSVSIRFKEVVILVDSPNYKEIDNLRKNVE